ncbi:MAG: four helix bundle protein [Patescibacteria group bacterium]|nr:four helix bundle protein [Patescibacteria group bacterium]
MVKAFFKLNIWQKGYKLVLCIYQITNNFPDTEKYALINQLKRASNSVIANIAESQGRYFYKDKIRILYQARGEIFEIRSHLRVAKGLKYLNLEKFTRVDQDYEGLLIGLNKYINYLSSQNNLN